MAIKLNRLTARRAATLAEPGRHSDGGGLYLNVTPSGARSWLFMWKKDGKRREMGLGSAASVPLASAREKAAECRKLVAAGKDPLEAKRAAQSAVPTFGDVTDALIAAKESAWRNEKHRWQWRHTLTEYAKALRNKAVDKITTEDVLAVLKPLWTTKPETASRLRGRIEAVLDAAKAQGHRSGENPAAWRGHLAHFLPKRQKLTRGHHAAMAYRELPAFVGRLREREGVATLALDFCILTAARTGEVIGATWGEFDLEEKVWTVPAGRMKAAKGHRVPLSDRAVSIVERMAEFKVSDFIFPSPRGRGLSNMAMVAVLRRLGVAVTVHGFRSAFRDWAGNETHFPREIAEAALAHVVGDSVERAYRRQDALEKRRALMDAWAGYCEPKQMGNVVTFLR